MSQDEILTLLRLSLALVVLGFASVLDWRTRRVPNAPWIFLSVVGLVLIPVQILIDDAPLEFALVLVPILAIMADVYWESDNNKNAALFTAAKYGVAIVTIVILGLVFLDRPNGGYFSHLLAVPALMLVIVMMYFLDIVKGGADAKAIISLSILFPFYPAINAALDTPAVPEGFDVVFPFAFGVLFTAAVIVALLPLGIITVNLAHRDLRFPQAFLGFRKDYRGLQQGHWWLMEHIEDGKHRFNARPRSEEDFKAEVDKLVGAGHTKIWVTARIPFMIPIFAAVILNAFLGNVLHILVSAL